MEQNRYVPGRLVPFVTDQIYHVFNRGIDRRPTFTDKYELRRALSVIDYYRFCGPKLAFSKFIKLSNEDRNEDLLDKRNNSIKHVEILAFCLMPNHFHFLLRQTEEKGISKFLSDFQNSYTRYFNTKNERDGALFLDQFRAVLIESDEQLIHVSRYIHLNPTTSYFVKDFDSLLEYPWSSLSEYLNMKSVICEIDTIAGFFEQSGSHRNFLEDQVEYQRELYKIKHLMLE